MASLPESLESASQIYLRLFTDRFTDLGPGYDPELPCTLSAEEIEQFKYYITDIVEHHGEQGILEIKLRFLADVTNFIDQQVLPQIATHIVGEYFQETFANFIRVLEEARLDLNIVLPAIPERNDISDEVSKTAVDLIYSTYGLALIEIVFDALGAIRQDENMNVSTYHVIEIAKHFYTLLDEETIWRLPYFERLNEHTRIYAEDLDIANATFVEKAFQRAFREELLSNSFELGGIEGRAKTRKAVLDAFCEVYDDFVDDSLEYSFDSLLQSNSEETQDLFNGLIRLYGRGNRHQTADFLKDHIVVKGEEMINLLRVPSNNNWTMDTLEQAVRELAKYEKAVYNRLRSGDNLNEAVLRQMLEQEFKKLCRSMFRSNVGGRHPEDYLAEFVEYIVSEPVREWDQEWNTRNLDYMNIIFKHMRRKDRFITYLQRRIRIYSNDQWQRRNRLFKTFLQMENVTTSVPEDFLEQVTNDISLNRVCFHEVAKHKALVVQVQCNTPLAECSEGLVPDLVEDSKCLYTVSVRNFCGSRKSVYLRMTACQFEVLNAILMWKKLSIAQIYENLIRDDVQSDNAQALLARDRIKRVVRSLMVPHALLKKEPNDVSIESDDQLSLNNATVFVCPYYELKPPVQGVLELETRKSYKVDKLICEFLAEHGTATPFQLMTYICDRVPVEKEVICERLKKLDERGFLMRPNCQSNTYNYLYPS